MGKSPSELEQELLAVIADIDLYSYYQLLDVTADASPDVITYQYNLKSYELNRLKNRPDCRAILLHHATLLLDRLDEARQVLFDVGRRREYDQGLELGQMRHTATVSDRSRPADLKGVGQNDAHLAQITETLERKLSPELLHEQVAEVEDRAPEGLDRYQLEQLSAMMAAKLARSGIELRVRDDYDQLDDRSPIDSEHLEQTLEDLQRRLDRLGVNLADEGEAEDLSADAEYAAELVQDLQAELQAMGLDMFDVAEVVDAAPEELFDEEGNPIERPQYRPELEPPKRASRELPPMDLPPELVVDVERLLQPEEEVTEAPFEETLPVEPVKAPRKRPHSAPVPRVAPPDARPIYRPVTHEMPVLVPRARTTGPAPAVPAAPAEDDPIPLIMLDDEE